MAGNPPENVLHLDRYREAKITQATPSGNHLETLPGWLGQSDMESLITLLSRSPGQITELLHQNFQVVTPWPAPGCMTSTGKYDLEAWPVGSTGQVLSVLYDAAGWSVLIEHRNDELGTELRWPEVPLHLLLRCTKPLVDRHEG